MSNNIELNDDWKYVRLPELADMKNGGTPSKKQSTYWKNGTIPFVTAADLISPYVNEGRSHLTEEGLKSGKTVICEPDDLLIGTRTRVGNCSICKKIMGASQDITRIRFKQKVVPEYFSWFFKNIGNDLSFYSQ